MATLSETASYTKKIIKFGIIAFLSFLILRLTFQVVKQVWQKYHPAPPAPATVSFGKLAKIQFPQNNLATPQEYVLETPNGQLPTLALQAKVYLNPYQQPSFLAFDRAKEKASQLGFVAEPVAISSQVYRWNKNTVFPTTLEIDIFSGIFSLTSDWQSDQSILKEKALMNKDTAILEAKSILKSLGILENDLAEGKGEASFLSYSGGKMITAPSLSEADFIKVEIFRKDIEEMPVLTADPQKGIASFIFSGSTNTAKKIIEAKINYFPVNYESWATYPLKSSSQAWEELKQGQAFITSFTNTNPKVTIRRIYLGYFDSEEPQDYLQPVIIFEGDQNFQALLPALTAQWLK